MSFYDDASLVVIPSGYKTSKVYSVKPTDGSGDLTFSRSNDTATRVNSAGLIEKVRTNLLTYSNDFSNAAWTKTNVTLTTGQADPNGGLTATTVDATNGTSAFVRQNISITSGVKYTWSVYIKGSTTGQSIALYTDGASNIYETKALTTSWQRFTGVATAASSGFSGFYILCGSGYSGLTDLPFDIAFGQVEASDIATDYIATTSAAVSVGPVANVPRLDYLGSTCGKLILEPQRTNLFTYSEQLDNAAYILNNATITANSVVSPDGYTNADTYTAAGSNNYLNAFGSSSGSNTITYSVFVKAGTQSVFRIREAFYFGTSTIFNLSTGTVTSGTGTITSYGNGWYRCTMSQAYGAGQGNLNIIFDTTASSGTFYLYGAQAEAGAYATSYIPTLGAAVTRGNDFASKSSINALIGGTSGTIFFEIKTNKTLTSTNYKQFFYYTDASSAQAYMYLNSSNTLVLNPSLGNISSSINLAADTVYKVAVAYATNDFKLYINGVERGSSTSGTSINAVNLLSLGSYQGTSEFNEFVFLQYIHFPTRLSNSDLAALTA